MAESAFDGPHGPTRHTPDPRQVRFAMSGLLLLGAGVGVLGAVLPLWAFELALDVEDAGWAFLGLIGGAVAGAAAALASAGADNRRSHLVFRVSAWLTAGGLISAAASPVASALALPLAAAGLGLGGVLRTTASALEAALTFRRAPSLMHLAGVSFGFGAAGVCLTAWLMNGWLGSTAPLAAAAGLFILLGWASGRRPKHSSGAPSRSLPWRAAMTPTGALLGIGLLLQAANYGALGGWLGLYVFRKLGVTMEMSLAVLAVFWVAVTSGRVAAARLPADAHRVITGFGVTFVAILGALFLLNTVDASGALVGALLLGAGAGAAHPLTLGAATRRHTLENPGVVRWFMVGSLVVGLGFAYLIAPLSAAWGIDVVLWTALICMPASLAALALIVLETRLSRSPAAAG